MLLSSFNGGLNTRQSANLIALNQGTIVTNVDLSKGNLYPLKRDKSYLNNSKFYNKPNIYRFKSQWLANISGTNYVEFNDTLYYTTGANGSELQMSKDGINFINVGLTAPTSQLEVTDSVETNPPTIIDSVLGEVLEENFEVGKVYEYRVVTYYNDVYKYKDYSHTYQGDKGITITIPSGTRDRIQVYRLYNSVYRLLEERGQMNYSFLIFDTVEDISDKVSFNPTQGSTVSKHYRYCYTYYNNTYNMESAPSPFSEEYEVLGGATISNIARSYDSNVDAIKLYRIGGDLVNWTLVGEYPNVSATIVDNYSDIAIAENEQLTTIGVSKPPSSLAGLTLYSATLFGFVGSTLYFSETGLVNQWSAFNTIEIPGAIIGLGATQNGLLVFTRNRTFLLRGSSSQDFMLIMLNGSQGCIARDTIKYVNNSLVWLSLDGVCSSIGGNITVISEPLLGKFSVPVAYGAEIYDNQYFLFGSTGTYVFDFRENLKVIFIDSVFNGGYYAHDLDSLILHQNTQELVEFAKEPIMPRQIVYKTGYLSDNGLTNVKLYKNIYIYLNGLAIVKVYLDGSLVGSYDVGGANNNFNDIKIPQDKMRAYYAELHITLLAGELFEIEFKTEGRQNGR